MSKIIVVTEVPRFSDAGSHQRCELTSEGKTWVFYIPWHFTQLAMPACEAVHDAHRQQSRKVMPFQRKRKTPAAHS